MSITDTTLAKTIKKTAAIYGDFWCLAQQVLDLAAEVEQLKHQMTALSEQQMARNARLEAVAEAAKRWKRSRDAMATVTPEPETYWRAKQAELTAAWGGLYEALAALDAK